MSMELGNSGSIQIGLSPSIVIPSSEVPEQVLRTDEKIQLLQTNPSTGTTFTVMANSGDTVPGYLDTKIDTSQFSIVANRITLIGFDGLTTDDLTVGSANLYYTQALFNASFSSKTTTNLPEGTNLYYTDVRVAANSAVALNTAKVTNATHTGDVTGATTLTIGADKVLNTHINWGVGDTQVSTADIPELTNLYYTDARVNSNINVAANTAARHTHANITYLNELANSGAQISNAVTLAHTHTAPGTLSILDAIEVAFTTEMYNKYEAYTSGMVTSAVSPIDLTLGVLSHISTDGNKHVPATSTTNNNKILTAGASAGVFSWTTFDTVAATSGIFETSPSTSIVKTLTSNYIKDHVENTLTAKHVTSADLTYIGTTIPTHIADALIHLPAIVSTTDQGKFLWVNSSDSPEWTDTSTVVILAGETYITGSGTNTLTLTKLDLAQTNITAGTNITFSTNAINAIQRPIEDTPTSGNNLISISSDWAYNHEITYGTGSHIPTGGTSAQYIAGDGTIADFSTAPGGIYKVSLITGGPTGSITARLVGATFPSGWSGAQATITTDLEITHTTTKPVIEVIIYAEDSAGILTKLIGTAAYTTIVGNAANTVITIQSLATIAQTIHIYFQFE